MSSLLNTFDREHLSIFEVRIKAVVASRLGVFAQGWQTEEELLASIGAKSPKAASLVADCIVAYTHLVEATEEKADPSLIEVLTQAAIETSKALNSEVVATVSQPAP